MCHTRNVYKIRRVVIWRKKIFWNNLVKVLLFYVIKKIRIKKIRETTYSESDEH